MLTDIKYGNKICPLIGLRRVAWVAGFTLGKYRWFVRAIDFMYMMYGEERPNSTEQQRRQSKWN